MKTEKYIHHGEEVSVVSEVKGMHRDHCLCYNCKLFYLEDREANCQRANLLFAFCVLHNMTTPVYECPIFVPKE